MHVAGLLSSVVLAFVASAANPDSSPIKVPTSTGRLRLTFAERSPLSTLDVVLSRMDMNNLSAKNATSLEYDLARLTFEVVVPSTYKPNVPHGLFVWLGVADFSPTWLNALARHKLILVVANTRRGRPALYGPPLDEIKKEMKLVITKGGNGTEWPPQEGRCDYEALRLDGFMQINYLEVPGLGHRPPDASWFENGIIALDQSLPLTPPNAGPTTELHPLPSQIAQAQRILAAAKYYLELKPPQVPEEMRDRIRKSYQDKARKYLQRLLEEYPTAPAAARAPELLQQMDRADR